MNDNARGVATIVRQKHLGGLDAKETAEKAKGILERFGLAYASAHTVAEEEAVDVYVKEAPTPETAKDAQQALEEAFEKADVFVQATEGRQKKLFFSDMDSTMIGQECIDEIAFTMDFGEMTASITERAMRGEIPFTESLKMRVALLKNAPVSALQEVYDKRIHLSEGAPRLLEGLVAHGVKTVLVSGGFTFFAKRVAEELGFDDYHANVLQEKDGVLTGKVEGDVLCGQTKKTLLEKYAGEANISPKDAMAVGDGANDIPMIETCGAGVAYRAKPATEEAARFKLRHNDLDALLYVMGYHRKGAAHAVRLHDSVVPLFAKKS